MLTFADLVGRDTEEFVAEGRDRVLFRSRAVDPAELLGAADLDELLQTTAVGPPYVKVTRQGIRLPDNAYTTTAQVGLDTAIGVLDPVRLVAEFRAGCTISWSDAQRYLRTVRQACAVVTAALAEETAAVVFATPAAKQGFNRHSDTTDVFAIQVCGTKTWQVWEDTRVERAGGAVRDPEIVGEPTTYTLEPGDCLYVPWGTPHVAHSNDAFSVHVSITVRPEFAAATAAAAIAARLPAGVRRGRLDPEALLAATRAVVDAGGDDAPSRLTPVVETSFFSDQALAGDGIDPARALRRTAEIAVGSTDDPDKRSVTVGPRRYLFPATAETVLKSVAQRDAVTIDQLVADGADRDLAVGVVAHLLRAGGLTGS